MQWCWEPSFVAGDQDHRVSSTGVPGAAPYPADYASSTDNCF